MTIRGRITDFIVREKLLASLTVILLVLLIIDPSLVYRIPRYVNVNALIVILCLLIISRSLLVSGLTNRVAVKLLSRTKASPRTTLFYIVLITYFLAPLIMNDGAVFVMVPLVAVIAELSGHEEALLVTIVALSANLASMILPIGNPQDIVIWTHFGISFDHYILSSLPIYLISMSLLLSYLYLVSRRMRVGEIPFLPRIRLDKGLAASSIASLIAVIVSAQLGFPLYGLIITIILVLISKPRIMAEIDYPLLAVFFLMFIDFSEIPHLLSVQKLIASFGPPQIYVLSVVLSQGISNVPATIALIRHTVYWKPLFLGVNIGGIGFLPGSMANIIALRLSRIGIKSYHRYALPFFLIMFLIGLLLVYIGIYG